MRIRGFKHIRRIARWAKSQFSGGSLILGYHRVANDTDDLYSNCVSPERFEEQLQVLIQYTQPITLDRLVHGILNNTFPERTVAITFDDGYVDNLHHAKPLLEKYGVPATLFVATGYLGTRFWWDELVHLLMLNSRLSNELTLNTGGQSFNFGRSRTSQNGNDVLKNRTGEIERVYRFLLQLPVEAREVAMDQLRRQLVTDKDVRASSVRAMTSHELRQMADSRLITIGAHTVSHPVLTNLSPSAQEFEIEQSKRDLEELVNHPIVAFSYPNGAGDETTRKLLRQAGYVSACNSFNDVTYPASDPFNLPRFWIPDWDAETFARWLQRWLPKGSGHQH